MRYGWLIDVCMLLLQAYKDMLQMQGRVCWVALATRSLLGAANLSLLGLLMKAYGVSTKNKKGLDFN